MHALLRSLTALALTGLVAAAPVAADNTSDQRQDLPGGDGPLLGGGEVGFGALITTSTIRVRLAGDGSQLNIGGAIATPCDDDSEPGLGAGAYNVPLGADGKFAGSVPFATEGPQATTSGEWSYSGTVTRGDYATGRARLRYRLTYKDGRPSAECDSGQIVWTARDPLKKPGAGTLKKGASYYGTRPDNRAVLFDVSGDKKRVLNFGFDSTFFQGNCTVGDPFLDATAFDVPNRKIKDGKFSYKNTFERDLGGGDVARATIRFSGKFGKKRVTGKLYYRVEGFTNGQLVSDCASPTLTWAAER